MLVTSNFSISHSVFKRLVSQGRQNVSLCGNGLKNKHHASFSPRFKLSISGSGKSTLLNIITGRLKCDSGSITVDGKPVDRELRRRFGYVLQNDVFFTNLTLWQTLYVSIFLCSLDFNLLLYAQDLYLPETMKPFN